MTSTPATPDLIDTFDYEPISDYAVIGDCRSAALVSRNGSIDWLCLPYFSSASIFAGLLDRRRGGRFLVRPRDVRSIQRAYRDRSAVLETTFQCASGVLRVTDFMSADQAAHSELIRLMECLEGEVVVDALYQPRPDYAQSMPVFQGGESLPWTVGHAGIRVFLRGDLRLEFQENCNALTGSRRLTGGQSCHLLMTTSASESEQPAIFSDPLQALGKTVEWWKSWCSRCSYNGPHQELVMRSCLTLKLLNCRDSGAVIAALTTSLPESYESTRNWDYRYCWLRDTSLLLQSFIDMGFRRESDDFLRWLLRVGRKSRLQPLYDLFAQPVPDERTLAHLEGYRGRGPVRIGNSAHQQLQLDIYGEVIQTAFRFVERGGVLEAEEKNLLVGLGEAVRLLWRQPDQSIWEPRTPPRHYTYSKLMCWVALDRLAALDQRLSMGGDIDALIGERDRIRDEIESNGFDSALNSYVGYFGGVEPDASLLLMLRYRYHEPGNPRLEGTFRYVMENLSADGFLYRYPPGKHYDGVEGKENLFAVCSFWAVDYLARSGNSDEASRLFDRLVELANDVGLYAEQFDRNDHSPLGNFPQAFTHAGLVTAALAIEQSRKGRTGGEISS